jgi:hypothetical protein
MDDLDSANASVFNTSLELFSNDSSTLTPPTETPEGCSAEPSVESNVLGLDFAVPAWEAIFTAVTLSAIILLTVVSIPLIFYIGVLYSY